MWPFEGNYEKLMVLVIVEVFVANKNKRHREGRSIDYLNNTRRSHVSRTTSHAASLFTSYKTLG